MKNHKQGIDLLQISIFIHVMAIVIYSIHLFMKHHNTAHGRFYSDHQEDNTGLYSQNNDGERLSNISHLYISAI